MPPKFIFVPTEYTDEIKNQFGNDRTQWMPPKIKRPLTGAINAIQI